MIDEFLRLVAAAVIALAVILAVLAARRLYRWVLDRHSGSTVIDLATRYGLVHGQATVLYFFAERCGTCVQMQEPALERLTATRPVVVRKLHAPSEADILNRFNIATVPSTIVVGPDLNVRRVNVGYVDEQTIQQQLA